MIGFDPIYMYIYIPCFQSTLISIYMYYNLQYFFIVKYTKEDEIMLHIKQHLLHEHIKLLVKYLKIYILSRVTNSMIDSDLHNNSQGYTQ